MEDCRYDRYGNYEYDWKYHLFIQLCIVYTFSSTSELTDRDQMYVGFN